ncbi:tripartite tricarboxylate transporter TctB family protein [Rhodoferax sp.]|uniref:tripartite tricarboxylate transporter TctB family protein n=1 Tax=Rhodoferax sp. TaxID=50421 RepID=UPI0026315FB2|nr:tripartite tricarboxylate transporter TctB family protein [Rhodoferax sp.]MDD2923857.1 tripartite tricarboxylate transporter TctB family protein [Rhodoferax sp.]
MRQHGPASHSPFLQSLVGVGVVLLALGLGVGAYLIPSNAGYAGVGPNFLPWLVTLALLACGVRLVCKARRGGFRNMEEHSGEHPDWQGFAWLSAGLLLNAALITTIGFIFSCALCFVLAARGLRLAEGRPPGQGWASVGQDTLTGLLIAAPVFWAFTKFLGINLPGLTQSGWL